MVPGNITLLELPPYSPELNPVERIWHHLRSHWLANSLFLSLADIMDACEMAWNRFATNPGLIRSLCAVAWAPASPARYVEPALWPQIEGTLASKYFRRSYKTASLSGNGSQAAGTATYFAAIGLATPAGGMARGALSLRLRS